MKTIIACIAFIGHFSLQATAQTLTTSGVYQGFDGTVYSFFDDNEDFVDFEKCSNAVLAAFDLKSEDLWEVFFEISYSVTQDGAGNDVREITGLSIIKTDE